MKEARRLASHEHGAGDVGGKHGFKAGAIEIHQVLEDAKAGVVHKDIQIAKLLEHFAIGALDIGFVGHVRLNRQRAQGFGRFRQTALIASGNGHAGAAGGQGLRDGPSDSGATAGDKRN